MSTKPIHCPSGERNGAFGVPSPVSGVGSSWFSARTKNCSPLVPTPL